VGYTPNLVAGLYIGFDDPKPLGRGATGGSLAAPLFNDFMQAALKNTKPEKFIMPEGMQLIAVNRKTGMQATAGDPSTILEAFKPGTGPADVFSVIGADGQTPEQILNSSQQAKDAVENQKGGLF
jgi:penicillin-binding protein 1A